MKLPRTSVHSIAVALLISAAGCSAYLLTGCESEIVPDSNATSAVNQSSGNETPEMSVGDRLREQSRGLLSELAKRATDITDPSELDSMRYQLALELAQAGETKQAVREVRSIENPTTRKQASMTAASFIAAHGDAESVYELLADISDDSLQPVLLRVRLTAHAYAGNTQQAEDLLQQMHAAGQKLGPSTEFDQASILLRSADGLLKRNAIGGARAALDEAEELLRSQPSSGVIDLLLNSLGTLRIQSGDLEAAAEAASLMSSADIASILRHRIAIEMSEAGKTDAAAEIAELVEEPRFRALAMASLGEAFANAGDASAAEAAFEDAHAASEAIDDPTRLPGVLCTIALNEHRAGRTEEALQTLDRAKEASARVARASRFPILTVAHAFREVGHPERADQIAQQQLQAGLDPANGPLWAADKLRQIAEVQSDPAAANRTLERAEGLIANSTDTPGNVYTLMQIALSHRVVGNDAGAERCVARARQLAMDAGSTDETARALEMIAQAHAEQGNLEAAIAVLDDFESTQQQTLALLKIATALRFAANRADAGMEE